MQQDKENLFRRKFRFLNSQEHSDDIKWTSSSSSVSEYENTSCEHLCSLQKNRTRKRKRKKTVPKNLSNLDITIIDPCKDHKSNNFIEKSPILKSKRIINAVSPMLKSKCLKIARTNSPILSRSFQAKSPIIQLKTSSPKYFARVRKKLLYDNNNKEELTANICDDRDDEINFDQRNISCENNIDLTNIKSEDNSLSTHNKSDSSFKGKLVERVKHFFDSNFSSDHTSQNISDTPTPTDISKSEDIDILSCKTQTVSYLKSIKLESSSNSDTSSFDKSIKKVKYKKGGLAYRLNALLKKQNAHISLWQHERFLAQNSKFIIPKEEHVVFRIQKVDFKYGCYLLSAVDFDSNKYFMLINKKYVNINIHVNSVFKLYEPYTILPESHQDYRIIIGICKFDSVVIENKLKKE